MDIEKYNEMKELDEKRNNFIYSDNKYWKYKNCIIKYLFDVDLTSEDFQPYYVEGNTISHGDIIIDYQPSILYVDFPKDIQKYEYKIISFIDSKDPDYLED